MQDYLRKIISSKEKGLYICQLPTGYGKSYCLSKIISELANDKSEKRKVIYLTTLKKNLPEDDIKKFLSSDEQQYNDNILCIHSNVDEVRKNIGMIIDDIPPELYSAKCKELISNIDKLNKAEKNYISDIEYKNELSKRISDSEAAFRYEIYKKLNKKFKNKSSRINAIKNNEKYKWIGKLYPAVFTDEHKVLLMTINKFFSKNSTIIEPSYDFLTSDMIKNSIIFIDEFDASKLNIQDDLIETALSAENEYITLFRQLHRNLEILSFSDTLERSIIQSEKSGQKWFDTLLQKGNYISERYYIKLSYKTADEAVDRKQNFLFHDGSFHTILDNNKNYIRAQKDNKENRVNIYLETKEKFYQSRTESDIQIYGLIREIHSYLTYFSTCLKSWGNAYCKIINSQREDRCDKMSLETAINTILSKLELSQQQKELILFEKCRTKKFQKKNVYPEMDFYSKGMEIFELEDSDEHNENTALQFIRLSDTPEKILRMLAEQATVFAVSATAGSNTVIGNYNLSYLSEKLGKLYHPMNKELYSRVKTEMDRLYLPYKNGEVRVHTEALKEYKKSADIYTICREIMNDDSLADAAAHNIIKCGVDGYYEKKYCNILKVMRSFWMHKEIKSLLYLGSALPKQDNSTMNIELLRKLLYLAAKDADENYCNDDLVVLSGNSFDNEKKRLLNELSNGKKRFVMSSYNTVGAGQNLQYNAPEDLQLIRITPYNGDNDKRHFTKDFDALYLDDITHVLVNTRSNEPINKKNLLKMLIHTQELYHIGEINYAEKSEMIKTAFKSYTGSINTKCKDNYHCKDVRIKKTRDVIQAVGRMNRTFLKSPDIYIFIDEKLLRELEVSEMQKCILSPELKNIMDARMKLGKIYSENENYILNIAEKISTESNYRIKTNLSQNWTEHSMMSWKELRELVMKYPTADEADLKTNILFRQNYITSGVPQARYFYSQYSDFSDITIDFGTDEIAFRNSGRAKLKGNSNTVNVSEMSEENSRLTAILKYSGMKDMFEKNGYAVHFEKKLYMMSPVLFNNIYKGALGETAGKFIFERERGIHLNEITDADKFEFFDFEMSDGVYVDFKNWKFSYLQDRQITCNEIIRKLEKINGKRVYVINIVKGGEYISCESKDSRIIEIPALIDENGRIIPGALDIIKKEDFE